MADTRSLGVVLRKIRLKKKMSLRDLAEELDISHAYIGKLENNCNSGKKITPTIGTLIKISKALQIPLDEFLYMCGYLDSSTTLESDSSKKFDNSIDAMDFFIHKCLEILKQTKSLSSEEKEMIEKALKLGSQIIKNEL